MARRMLTKNPVVLLVVAVKIVDVATRIPGLCAGNVSLPASVRKVSDAGAALAHTFVVYTVEVPTCAFVTAEIEATVVSNPLQLLD